MKRLMGSFVLLIVITAVNLSAEDFPWHRYSPITIEDLCTEESTAEAGTSTEKPLQLRNAYSPPIRYRSTVFLVSVEDTLRPMVAQFLEELPLVIPSVYKKEYIEYYGNEISIKEKSREYKLPIQSSLIEDLIKETRENKKIEIFYYYAGFIKSEPVLLINDFQVRE